MTMGQAALAALLLMAGVPAAQAQGAPAAPAQAASSPAKKELVQKVLKLNQQGIEGVGEQLAGDVANQRLQMAGSAMGSVPEARREAVAKEVQAEVKKFYDESAAILRNRAVQLAPGVIGPALEERFSEDDLRVLVTWLESPVSRKYAQLSGDVQGALGQKLVAETRGQIEPKLKALDSSLAAKFNQPGPQQGAPQGPARPAPAAGGAAKK
jgi:hypothetical protein